MVARIMTGQSIKGALNYNEVKVREGKAECIHAAGFVLEKHEMNFHDKLRAFTDLTTRNRRSKTNVLHVSLNFHRDEQLGSDKLTQIADLYMEGIGFANQPYLVYQHFDSAHPHVHILSTSIQRTGKRISLHNLGRHESEAARKQIEQEFGLIEAESKPGTHGVDFPTPIEKAIYGKSETKRSIANIVRFVTERYRFTSLPELNAALRQFNVVADRGREGTLMYDKKGLIYSLLDKNGERVGVPIKASSISFKPTLPHLEKKFAENQERRQPHQQSLRERVEAQLLQSDGQTRQQFTAKLKAQGIYVLFRDSRDGRTYGVTFVDNHSRCVFNGSTLSRSLTAKSILERLSTSPTTKGFRPGFSDAAFKTGGAKQTSAAQPADSILSDLFHAELPYNPSPEELLRLKKRKGRSIQQ